MSGGPGAPPLDVVEYTDPMCPWAWGSEPAFHTLRTALAGRARRRRAYAVLFDEEEDDLAPDPAAETACYAGYVERITAHTHAPRAARRGRTGSSSARPSTRPPARDC
ncbi:hypothetical protein ACFQ6U_15350 [Streptomyces sp. NPDC056465]|uniref:hypothetical protein n=1 Tax=unclassified Streptomyces TaxID=2593676 RepID=UPI0035D9C064